MKYTVFDVETPNMANDSISSIGVCVVQNGKITKTFASLVNPETHFDIFNSQLTGITPQMVQDKPNFAELWPTLKPMFDGAILVAHNAPFDMGVLAKVLGHYNIAWKPSVQCACTVKMGRKCFPHFPNHRLDTMCRQLDIQLDHHRADSDSTATANLLVTYLQQGIKVEDFAKQYKLPMPISTQTSLF